jgi:hypothetical protein
MQYLFDDYSASLYEDRWREVVNYIRALKPLMPVLQNTWSAPFYATGMSADDEQRPRQAKQNKLKTKRREGSWLLIQGL